jgi:hypothetical protein
VAGGSGVSIFLGRGDGTFLPPVYYATGSYADFVTIADLTGNGILDLVVANKSMTNHSVSVLLGNGDGTFQQVVAYGVDSGPTAVAVGDLNGDGIPDLVTANNGTGGATSSISILFGNGDGTFKPAVTDQLNVHPYAVAVGDVNGDGVNDLVLANKNTDNVSVLLGNGDGTFHDPVNYSVGGAPEAVVLDDLNRNGHLDIVVANYSQSVGIGGVGVLLGNGDGSFQKVVQYGTSNNQYAVAVGDFNGDGIPDLACVGTSGEANVLLGNGDGSFQAAQTFHGGYFDYSVAVGDFKRDGTLDLAVVTDGGVVVLLNDGVWSTPAHPRSGPTASPKQVGWPATVSDPGVGLHAPVESSTELFPDSLGRSHHASRPIPALTAPQGATPSSSRLRQARPLKAPVVDGAFLVSQLPQGEDATNPWTGWPRLFPDFPLAPTAGGSPGVKNET